MAYEKTLGLYGSVINGIDEGGEMSISIDEGYDEIIESAPDGTEVAVVDRESQYVRGTGRTQAWATIIALLTGTLGEYVFYERKSGVVPATGFLKHALTNPIIWDVQFDWSQGQYGAVVFKFECRFAAASDTIADVHVITDSQAMPTLYGDIELGGYRITSALLGALPIYSLTAFNFHIGLKLTKACNDGWLGYGNVDAEMIGGVSPEGSFTCQDSAVAANAIKSSQILAAARASLVLNCKQAFGAANKTVTIAGVMIMTSSTQMSGDRRAYAQLQATYRVSNSLATPLTLAGANKIITIADAA